jgi:integrase
VWRVVAAPLERTSLPGVYRRGSRYVVVYRRDGRQHRRSVATLVQARSLRRRLDAERAERMRGVTLHAYALRWVGRHAGSGHDTVNERTRTEYRRLLDTYALAYFDPELALADIDHAALQGFVGWLTLRPGSAGARLSDRSIRNALTPLRRCLEQAVADGVLERNPAERLVLPRRRAGKPYRFDERRFLTRAQLARLIAELPPRWRPPLRLLASTGLRISEAIALRWSDMELAADPPRLRVRRAIVAGQLTAPKSRYGIRAVPLSRSLAAELRRLRQPDVGEDELVFPAGNGAPLSPGNLRNRVLAPAAARAGVPWASFHTLRHTCAALLVAAGASPLRLQRWMGHHSPAYTLEAYGHLIDGELGTALDLDHGLG